MKLLTKNLFVATLLWCSGSTLALAQHKTATHPVLYQVNLHLDIYVNNEYPRSAELDKKGTIWSEKKLDNYPFSSLSKSREELAILLGMTKTLRPLIEAAQLIIGQPLFSEDGEVAFPQAGYALSKQIGWFADLFVGIPHCQAQIRAKNVSMKADPNSLPVTVLCSVARREVSKQDELKIWGVWMTAQDIAMDNAQRKLKSSKSKPSQVLIDYYNEPTQVFKDYAKAKYSHKTISFDYVFKKDPVTKTWGDIKEFSELVRSQLQPELKRVPY